MGRTKKSDLAAKLKAAAAASGNYHEKLDKFVIEVGQAGFHIQYAALRKLAANIIGKEKIRLDKALSMLSEEAQSYIVNSKNEVGYKAPDSVKEMFSAHKDNQLISNGDELIKIFNES